MKTYLIFPVIFAAASLSAATYELDLQEAFPQQNIFKTLTVEGEALQIQTNTSDEGLEASLSGPEVEFRLTTVDGENWSVPLGSFELNVISQNTTEGNHVLFDFEATSLIQLGRTLDFSHGNHKFAASFFKACMSPRGPIRFAIEASSSTDLPDSMIMFDYVQGKQLFHVKIDKTEAATNASWNLQTRLLGKGALIDLLITALREINSRAQNVTPESPAEELFKNICFQVGVLMDFAAPILDWDGVNLSVEGESTYQDQTELYAISLQNDFTLSTPDNNWKAFMGTRSHYVSGPNLPYAWRQEFVITNLTSDIDRLCQWVQANAIDQLAEFLNMPSITYYGSYFPKYFNQGLAALILKLGTPQEDGTLILALNGGEASSISFGTASLSEMGQLLIDTVKEKVSGYWGK